MTSDSQSPPRQYRFADLALDTGQRRLWRGDEQIQLSKLTFDFLLTLVEAAPNLVTQDRLTDAVWGPRRVVSPESLSQRLKTLRGALGERADHPRYIDAVRGQGYRLIPNVDVIDVAAQDGRAIGGQGRQPSPRAERTETPADSPVSEGEAAPVEGRGGNSSTAARDVETLTYSAAQKLNYIVMGLLATAVMFLILDNYVIEEGPVGNAATDAQRTDFPTTIAVLPFVNNSSDPEQEYFAEGLSEELMNVLNRIEGLEVASHSASLSFEEAEDVPTVARALGLGYVLEGSVERDGNDVRIRTRLTSARTALTLWSATYDREFEDIFAIQDDIATNVATALQITLAVGEPSRLPGMTRDVEAHGEYLQGLAAYKSFNIMGGSIQRAIDHLQRATDLDPEFALAWYLLSRTHSDGPPHDLARSEAALERARALIPDAPYVLRGVADASAARGDWLSAGAFYEDLPADVEYGVDNNPAFVGGVFSLLVGRVDDAVVQFERARAIDPLDGEISWHLGLAYQYSGRLEEALAEFDRVPNEEFGLFRRANAMVTALSLGDRDELAKRLALLDGPITRLLAEHFDQPAAVLLDEPAAAWDLLRRLTVGGGGVNWAAFVGQPEYALSLFRADLPSVGADTVAYFIWSPLFSDMRALPGFKDLVRDMGLVEYWRVYGWPDDCSPVDDEDFECS